MNWIPRIFLRGKLYNDLSEGMRLHLEERAEQLMAEGMSQEEAERAARRAFGNRTLIEERSREVWGWPWIESMWGMCGMRCGSCGARRDLRLRRW